MSNQVETINEFEIKNLLEEAIYELESMEEHNIKIQIEKIDKIKNLMRLSEYALYHLLYQKEVEYGRSITSKSAD